MTEPTLTLAEARQIVEDCEAFEATGIWPDRCGPWRGRFGGDAIDALSTAARVLLAAVLDLGPDPGYTGPMPDTKVRIDPEQLDLLRARATATRVTVTSMIRAALAAYLQMPASPTGSPPEAEKPARKPRADKVAPTPPPAAPEPSAATPGATWPCPKCPNAIVCHLQGCRCACHPKKAA